MQKEAIKLTGQATQDEINAWKKENPKGIYGVEVGGHIGYFRNPTRQDVNIAASQLDADNPIDYFEIIMRETKIGGSDQLIENDQFYLGALNQVRRKIEGEKAKLVNL